VCVTLHALAVGPAFIGRPRLAVGIPVATAVSKNITVAEPGAKQAVSGEPRLALATVTTGAGQNAIGLDMAWVRSLGTRVLRQANDAVPVKVFVALAFEFSGTGVLACGIHMARVGLGGETAIDGLAVLAVAVVAFIANANALART